MTHRAEMSVVVTDSEYHVGQNVMYKMSAHGDLIHRDNFALYSGLETIGKIVKVTIIFEEKTSFDLRNFFPFRVLNNRVEYDVYNGTEIVKCSEWELLPAPASEVPADDR